MKDKPKQEWFEMGDVRRKVMDKSVWIPLRAALKLTRTGEYGYEGFTEEFFGVGSLAVPLGQRAEAGKLGWSDVGISGRHFPYIQDGQYVPVDQEKHRGVDGVRLVIDQPGNRDDVGQWHLHPDIVVALGLRLERDAWLAIDEGYEPVARIRRDEDGRPILLEIRAEQLKDYLCARSMALYVNSFRSRTQVLGDAGDISWDKERGTETNGPDRWEGRVDAIHEGGTPFGSKTAVFHAARTDVDPTDDVPTLGAPNGQNIRSRHWTTESQARKLFRISGELWRSEWVEPGASSPRVRRDEQPSSVTFVIDAAGTREPAVNLEESGRWLWFRPDVIPALAHRRGGALSWYTRDTGGVSCSPDYRVHFGVNELGLVTVYAKDVALLPEWQQRIWAGFNVSPDGRVSAELLKSQVEAQPADTLAPEAYLGHALETVNAASTASLGVPVFKEHEQQEELLAIAHRFRAVNEAGLFSLAKDVARLTADRIDAASLQRIVSPPKGEKWGTLKTLENVIARRVGRETARAILSPLVGAYELRHADAHLPSSELGDALGLVRIDPSLPYPHQGLQLLHICVSSLYAIAHALEQPEVGAAQTAAPNPSQ